MSNATRLQALWVQPTAEHPLYKCWDNIKQRCYNRHDRQFVDYGGRGILMDPRWRSDFWEFVLDMGHIPEGTSIERIDNNKGYYSWNCKWAYSNEQQTNKRARTGNQITFNGVVYKNYVAVTKAWCISRHTLRTLQRVQGNTVVSPTHRRRP